MFRFKFWMMILVLTGQMLLAQGGRIEGVVRDAGSRSSLAGANIEIPVLRLGVSSDAQGHFALTGLAAGRYQLRISYIGYETVRREVTVAAGETAAVTIELKARPLRGREISVVATRAVEGETPAAFSTLTREDIAERYYAQDIPVLLSELPSTTFYSEGGNGIGYNYLSIRGFDQRRISVMINGVPQNDPEDHNVYWVDFPDLLGNVEDIQVQRGAGSAFYGPPAIGGSINIVTSQFSPERKLQAYSGFGSYNTRKFALGLNSGLLNNRWVFSARVSQIRSDSYREWAAVDFKSFFLGAAYFGEKSTTRLHAYGGPIEDQLAYYGISKAEAEDRATRRNNYISGPQQVENFNQPHLELINTYALTPRLTLNNILTGVRGYGFFDYDGSWAPFSYFRLTPEYGFDISGDPENLYAESLLIRAYVDNRQGGWFPNLTWEHERGTLVAGGEIRTHRSLHWGRIQDASGDLPLAVSGDYRGRDYIGARRYYEYKGAKDILSPYLQGTYRLSPQASAQLSLQYVYQKYRLYDEKFIGTEFDLDYHFLNPRVGVNVTLSPEWQLFTSFARVSREPRLKNFYDAAEASTPASWGAVIPAFERNPDGSYDFDSPLVKPEQLNDVEIGLSYRSEKLRGDINLYYMDFQDEIVKSGQLDRFGQPVTGNAERTVHAGIEANAMLQLNSFLSGGGNLTLSRNELKRYSVYDSDGSEIRLDGNPIAGFPEFLANARLNFRHRGLSASLMMQHVGKQYSDNFQNEANTVDAYTVFNGMIGCRLSRLAPLSQITLQLHIQNIFDRLYITHGEGTDFFPAAERHFFVNMMVEL